MSELNIFVLIMRENMLISRGIYDSDSSDKSHLWMLLASHYLWTNHNFTFIILNLKALYEGGKIERKSE